ncbi:MAG: DUF2087 domain-containing protein [Micromonosporaceae bacterium]
MPDALDVLKLLADPPRLRVFSALVLGAATPAEVADATGLGTGPVLRLLARLESGGIVARDGERWRARPELLRELAATASPEPAYVDHGASDAEERAVLRVFMPQGRLVSIPAPHGKRRIVLDQISRIFEPGVRYPEREVNAMLKAFHDDHAALRRYLVDEGFLSRESGEYWRIGGTVTL